MILTLGISVLAGIAQAAPMQADFTYQTIGVVGLASGSDGVPISFHGIDSGSSPSSTPFSLGDFEIGALPQGYGTKAVDLPFTIIFRINTVDGATPQINETPALIKGWLTGTLSDTGQSQVRAIFDSGPQVLDPKYFDHRMAPPFRTGDLMTTLNLDLTSDVLGISTANGGRTTIPAWLDVAPIPEPSSVALFLLSTVAVLVARRRGRSKIV
jgi:hypothetical protein